MDKKLSMTEKYTLLMLYGGGRRTDFMACQFAAGIVLGGLLELIQAGDISVSRGNKLSTDYKAKKTSECFSTLYENICRQSGKSMQSWLEYYCFNPTYKNIRPVIDDMLNTLADKGFISIEWHRGLFRKKRSIEINATQTAAVVDEFVSGVQSGKDTDEIIFCAEMLLLADVFKSYFPMGKRWGIKSTLNSYKHSEIWSMMEPYANAVRNFNYQNTVYTGASQ